MKLKELQEKIQNVKRKVQIMYLRPKEKCHLKRMIFSRVQTCCIQIPKLKESFKTWHEICDELLRMNVSANLQERRKVPEKTVSLKSCEAIGHFWHISWCICIIARVCSLVSAQ